MAANKWRMKRAEYIDSIASAEADDQLILARLRAQRARQLLLKHDTRMPEVEAVLERLTLEVGALDLPIVVSSVAAELVPCQLALRFSGAAPTCWLPCHRGF